MRFEDTDELKGAGLWARSRSLRPMGSSESNVAACDTSRHGIFSECPQCGGAMAPEHAHYRCRACGWRDSCCD